MGSIRLRFPAIVSLLAILSVTLVWTWGDLIRQLRVVASILILAIAGLLVFGWFVFASGASKRARMGVTASLALVLGAAAGMFRIRGVSGDMVPILEYRFTPPRALPEAQPLLVTAQPLPISTVPSPGSAAKVPVQDPAAPPKVAKGANMSAPPPPSPGPGHADWPQYLGPNRSGVIPEADLAADWSARPPRLLWRQPIGAGWAGFAVSADLAVTQEQRGNEERVIAYNLKTGQPLWSHADKARHDSPLGSVGPRAVPAIDGGQVFALGATGILNALDARNGARLWSRNILDDSGGAEPEWGVAISPLVRGPRVIVSAGGASGKSLIAYDRQTGEPVWTKGSAGLAYSSPVVLNLAGRDQIVMLNKASVAGHDPETGALLWTQEFPREQPNVSQPLPISANRVLFSVGYGIGSKVFEISSSETPAARLVWSTPRLKSKFANMVAHEGSIYGLDDGVMVCLDPETGERRWKNGRYGHGQLILAGKLLLVQTEEGEVVMIDPSPERLIEVTRFQALSGKTWNPPALAAPILLVRNDLEAAAYELPVIRR